MNIIIVGKAASGKDYFKKYLLTKGFKGSIAHTTRPIRDNEVNGIDYHFIKSLEFKDLISIGYFYEAKEFNGWLYGTSKLEMNKSNVFIFTPSGIKSLPKEFLKRSKVVYFDIDESIRIERLNARNDIDNINRRVLSDNLDFKDFKDYDIKITNHNFCPNGVLLKLGI